MSVKAKTPVLFRSLCNSLSQTTPSTDLSVLPSNLRSEARKLLSAISTARGSARRAVDDDSHDDERRQAVIETKYALQLYVRLVSKGNPPVKLSESGSALLCDNPNDVDSLTRENRQQKVASLIGQKVKPLNDVMRVLGDEVQQMKDETFRANRQRVWIGWRGWF